MNRIKELRQSEGWRQEDLARRLNISDRAVGHYETGRRAPDVETILALCDIFGCTADYLLGRCELRSFDLSEDEAALLTNYRTLSDPGKEYVRHSLALAALAHAEKNRAVSDLAVGAGALDGPEPSP